MKLLLVGPYPPPHGGVSVHVAELERKAQAAGIPCRVLDTGRSARGSSRCTRVPDAVGFLISLLRHALQGWTIHVHTNGHNVKSWLVALAGGMTAIVGTETRLTLHSGGLPEYLRKRVGRRRLAALVCRFYGRVICVSPAIREALESLGVAPERLEVAAAFSGLNGTTDAALPVQLEKWLERHFPVVAATGSEGREYGIELLVESIARLRVEHPAAGCIVIGAAHNNSELRRSIDRRGLTRDVLLLGDVSHEQCLRIIAGCSVFVRPTFMDGDSISVREAVSLGVPVVASDVVNRPSGCTLFQTGNSRDLSSALEWILQERLKDCAR